MLRVVARLAAAELGGGTFLFKLTNDFFHRFFSAKCESRTARDTLRMFRFQLTKTQFKFGHTFCQLIGIVRTCALEFNLLPSDRFMGHNTIEPSFDPVHGLNESIHRGGAVPLQIVQVGQGMPEIVAQEV